jgi:hypothetical protein
VHGLSLGIKAGGSRGGGAQSDRQQHELNASETLVGTHARNCNQNFSLDLNFASTAASIAGALLCFVRSLTGAIVVVVVVVVDDAVAALVAACAVVVVVVVVDDVVDAVVGGLALVGVVVVVLVLVLARIVAVERTAVVVDVVVFVVDDATTCTGAVGAPVDVRLPSDDAAPTRGS